MFDAQLPMGHGVPRRRPAPRPPECRTRLATQRAAPRSSYAARPHFQPPGTHRTAQLSMSEAQSVVTSGRRPSATATERMRYRSSATCSSTPGRWTCVCDCVCGGGADAGLGGRGLGAGTSGPPLQAAPLLCSATASIIAGRSTRRRAAHLDGHLAAAELGHQRCAVHLAQRCRRDGARRDAGKHLIHGPPQRLCDGLEAGSRGGRRAEGARGVRRHARGAGRRPRRRTLEKPTGCELRASHHALPSHQTQPCITRWPPLHT